MTLFPHIGDLHLKPGHRNADRLKALDDIIDDVLGFSMNRLGAWLMPGDLNDARMSIDDRNALVSRFVRMARYAPVVTCYGNHDLPGDLDVFRSIKARFPIYVADQPGVLDVTLATGEEAAIFALPYPTRAGLAALGFPHQEQLTAADEALSYVFMLAGDELADARAHGRLTLAIGHANIAGAISSTGQPQIGKEIDVTADHLMRLGDCYKGFNHIHLGQQIGGAWYPGSVCRMDFGEIHPKRYLVVECEPNPVLENDWVYDVIERPLDVRPMFHVDGQLTKDGFTYAVTNGPGGELQPKPATWQGCEVRVRYTFPKSEAGSLSKTLVTDEFAQATYVQYEPIAQPDRAVRAPEVAAARTLEEKARAWAALNGIAMSDALIEKLHAIANGDAQQFLSALAARLADTERREEVAA